MPLFRRWLRPHAVPIPEALWQAQYPRLDGLLGGASPPAQRLRELCSRFLAQKSISPAAGLQLDAAMQLHIATQACLPILNLGLHWYRGWSGIVVYPARFRVRRRVQQDDGLEHEMDAELSGEAWDGGPVVLSWDDSGFDSAPDGGNVVIHEFAHTLDLLDGNADGHPPLDRRLHPGLSRALWSEALGDAYERFCAGLDLIESDIPADVDPEGPGADAYYARLPLDPYAATDPAEFFAVCSEALFVQPEPLRDAFPHWFALLRRFYRLDQDRPGDL